MNALHILMDLLCELVAPSACAACNVSVPRAVLFCASCAATVERAISASNGRSYEHAAFEYGGAMATAITTMKYASRPDLASRLAASMLPVALRLKGGIDLVVPVPLFPSRLAERGYNQSALLAHPIARAIGATFAPRTLMRIRDTPRQAELDRHERLRNTSDAFRLRRASSVSGRRVLLVDDVRTTGATLDACTHALVNGDAAEVRWLVLARRT